MSSSEETTTVENWAEYSDALVDRGRLTIWISEEAIQDWKADREPQQGAQWIFTDGAIETCLQIKMVYGLTLRETEGFVESLFALFAFRTFGTGGAAGSRLHDSFETTLSKRQGDLDIDLPTSSKSSPMHLVLDSTGLKVYGEGEWKQRIHGKQKRRTWRKLHLGVDSDTGQITAVTLTDNTDGDSSQVEPLLEETMSEESEQESSEQESSETSLDKVGADGAYDTFDVYKLIDSYGASPVIPPQKNAKIQKHGNAGGPPLPRDEAIRYIRGHGRNKWKRVHDYHQRSLAETAVYRFKGLMGRFVEARTWKNERTEVRLKAKTLNQMTRLGMPKTNKTAS